MATIRPRRLRNSMNLLVIMGHVGSHDPRRSAASFGVNERPVVTVVLMARSRPAGS